MAKPNRGNKSPGGKPKQRARRLTDEETKSFREKRKQNADGESSVFDEQGNESSGETQHGRQRQSRQKEKQYNVHLFISPRLLNLADELADEAGVPTQRYLVEAIKYVLLTQAGRLGKRDKYKAEFTSKAKVLTSTWRPESKEEEGGYSTGASHEKRERHGDDRRANAGRGRGHGGDDRRGRGGEGRRDRGGEGRGGHSGGSGRGRGFEGRRGRGSRSGGEGARGTGDEGRRRRDGEDRHGRGRSGQGERGGRQGSRGGGT